MGAFLELVTMVFLAAALGPMQLHAQSQPAESERILLDSANRERALQGLQPLHWDAALAAAARRHAELMAARNILSHQLAGEDALGDRAHQAGGRFSFIAENIAFGPSPDLIHLGWMDSPLHRANILRPDVSAVGIAMVAAERTPGQSEDKLFAVEDFSKPVPNLGLAQQEQQVGALLVARNLRLLGEHENARKACVSGGYADERAGMVLRFEDSDLSRLPDGVVKIIKRGQYRSVAVGACAPLGTQKFAHFRIAILFFAS